MAVHQTQVTATTITRKQSLIASVSRACKGCGAPGVYQNDKSWIDRYPELYRPAWAGRDVGSNCPHCGQKRPEIEKLGEIWSREWVVGGRVFRFFHRLVERVRSLMKGQMT